MRSSAALAVLVAAAVVGGCGSPSAGDAVPADTAPDDIAPDDIAPEAGAPVAPGAAARGQVDVPVAVGAPTQRRDQVAPSLQAAQQPAIWPSADVVFATPEEVAADFVRTVLLNGEEPTLGEFRRGDARSGEMPVISPGDGPGAAQLERGVLFLRQLGPDDGWFVIGAASDGATITRPSTGDVVAAGPLTVEGEARGFEGTVVVSAFPAGDAATMLDLQVARGGAFADNEPYSATIDLANAMPAEVVAVLVQGDTGLETDPGTFAAIPVVVEDVIPPTR